MTAPGLESSDEQIEQMVRDLIEDHLEGDVRVAALDWLRERSIAYGSMINLGLAKRGDALRAYREAELAASKDTSKV